MSIALAVALLVGQDAAAQTLEDVYTCRYLPESCKAGTAPPVAKTDGEAGGDLDDLSLGSRRTHNGGGITPVHAVTSRTSQSTNVGTTPRRVTRITPSRPQGARCDTSAAGMVSPDDIMIQFARGSAELDCTAQANLLTWASVLKNPKLTGLRFRIDGHTSAIGTADMNHALSERRAAAVVSFLASNGVDRSRLEMRGWGFDKPLPNVLPTDSANRRVEAVKLN